MKSARPALTGILLVASTSFGQQAILPRKGRQPDRTPAAPAEPIRRLPRPAPPRTAGAGNQPASFGPHAADRAQSPDRLRPLLRGAITPAAEENAPWIRALPQAPVAIAAG